MNNMQFSAKVIQKLLELGVEEFCLCAGARNSPLIKTFAENTQIKVYHFFEERSASFFALGRILALKKPVAVVTTSGTAVSELLSATIEAFYQGLPLILLTADRPKSYRLSGAPQTIEQLGIFSHYVETCIDVDIHSASWNLESYSGKKPLHFNICFDEPLMDGEAIKLETGFSNEHKNLAVTKNFKHQVEAFIQGQKPLVILSGSGREDQEAVLSFLEDKHWPLFVETTSGLRNHPQLLARQLQVPEKTAKHLLLTGKCDSVLRIGGIPTTRLWRDFEFQFKSVEVLSITNNSFSGLSRSSTVLSPISALRDLPSSVKSVDFEWSESRSYDQKQFEKLNFLLEKYPQSEPALVRKLSKLTHQSPLYLGNSMPIREWDLAISSEAENLSVMANRGANGIDGQVSTFLGTCLEGKNNWALIGDLTALYDLPSLWISKQIFPEHIFLVVLNNSGGMIFNRIFKSEYFLNRHEIEFSHWAQMWSWKYEKWADIPLKNTLSGRTIIELVPQEQQTQLFWEEWDKDDRN